MHVHFVQHESFEAPGAYLKWAEERGYEVSFSKIYEYQPLPGSANHIDLLIVMGGPQDPETSSADCPYFNAAAEIGLIQRCIRAGKSVVGVCLGSQLIGEALGAKYEHSPEKEIGNFRIRLTPEGAEDAKLSHFGSPLIVGHWHNDMPGLTADSKILATSEGCPRQIIKYSNLVYGFQCHLELNREVAELLIASDDALVYKSAQYRFVQSPDVIRGYDYTEMNGKLYTFLDKLIEDYQHRSPG